MSRATACFSMYSLMSMRIMLSSLSKSDSASARASSVLPTPVGPRKMNEPMGRLGSFRLGDFAILERRHAAEVAVALGLFHFVAGQFEGFAKFLDVLDDALLAVPLRFEGVALTFEFSHLFLKRREAFLAGLVFFLAQ